MTARFVSDPNTLGFLTAVAPVRQQMNLASVPMKSAIVALDKYESGFPHSSMVTAEHDAVKFYLFSHCLADIQAKVGANRPMTVGQASLVRDLLVEQGALATKFYYYVLKITLREFRHLKSPSSTYQDLRAFDLHAGEYLRRIMNPSHVKVFEKALVETTPAKFLPVLQCLEYGFYTGGWSSGYGGSKWGVVARSLRRFVEGRYSPEVLLDCGWALAHNGGPIFNKGYFYTGYDQTLLLMALDAQRAGVIPNVVRRGRFGAEPQLWLQWVEKEFGITYSPKVDWVMVDRLGAKGHWMHYQSADWGSKSSEWASKPKATVADIMQQEMSNPDEIIALFGGAPAPVTTPQPTGPIGMVASGGSTTSIHGGSR